ncbi:hypothetical protein DQ04_01241170 [Trypanosoma grayi]|uniref:hypothetical protein n=1 Tax=Trypanosoma grayi TaxID=71804 RepID=UPI0004F45515|nr:hypothetical protein DQ04_01241170 [Trypanosoma grayi]KEG13062.1 hypothetical protein DQ04_01241170 [Trypanosoma grayi]
MGIPPACPYCGEEFSLSTMWTHISLCSSCPSRDDVKRTGSTEAAQSHRRSAGGTDYNIDPNPCMDMRIPSRSPSNTCAPTVRVDLRPASVEQPTPTDVKVLDLWSYPEPKRRPRVRCSSASLPSPPHAFGSDQLRKTDDSPISTSPLSLPKDTWNKERNCRTHDEINEGGRENNGSDGYIAPVADPQLIERVFQLETTSRELREALEVERRARQKSAAAVEDVLAKMRSEIATLYSLVAGATKSAEAAHYGVQVMERRLRNYLTPEMSGGLQQKTYAQDALLRASKASSQQQRNTPCRGVDRSALAGASRENISIISRDTRKSAPWSGAGSRELHQLPVGTPFLHKDTGEAVAQLLHLQPVAVIHAPTATTATYWR